MQNIILKIRIQPTPLNIIINHSIITEYTYNYSCYIAICPLPNEFRAYHSFVKSFLKSPWNFLVPPIKHSEPTCQLQGSVVTFTPTHQPPAHAKLLSKAFSNCKLINCLHFIEQQKVIEGVGKGLSSTFCDCFFLRFCSAGSNGPFIQLSSALSGIIKYSRRSSSSSFD